MSINRDEALRAKDLAEGLMRKSDFTGARKLALKAQKMDSSLENISRMIMVCDVHCAAENMFGNDKDWYGILQVELADTDITVKKQYRKLALLLHPDKNKFPGAESAFKLIGEAQRILLDCEKRTLHDIKRRTSRKPGAPTLAPTPSYRPRPVPNYQTQHVYAANGNVRNMFNELRPENRHPQQQAQAQPAGFGLSPTFFTTCLFCHSPFEYYRIHMNKMVTCQTCSKKFTALETPMPKSTCQTNFSFPQQNMFPGQKATNEPQKRPENPVSRKAKASVPMPPAYTAENNNAKKKRKAVVESSESSVSSSETEEDDVATNDTKSSMSNAERRRSVRSKRQVSYNENVSDDDVGLGNENGEASGKDVDTEREEEPEDEKQTNEDHRSTESKDSKKKKKKMMEDQVESSDPEEDLSEADAEPNIINYDDPDFNDFDKLREKSCFEAGQIWALYDEDEGMPRFYALIKKVFTPNFLVKYVWLEADDDQDYETHDLPVSVGKYELGGEEKANDCSVFSHLVVSKTKNRARKFKVFPKKGETWALFKNWETEFPELDGYEYEFAEILSDHAEGDTVTVGWLSKVKGFSCVFQPMPNDDGSEATSKIPPQEFCRFSHSIPFFKLSGTEGRGVLEGWYELDPAALPETVSKKNQDNQSPLSG